MSTHSPPAWALSKTDRYFRRSCADAVSAAHSQQGTAASQAQQQQPARALLSIVQQYIRHLAAQPPAAAAAPPASIPYVLPEGELCLALHCSEEAMHHVLETL